MRQAGWIPGLLVLVLDLSKGYLPVYLASQIAPVPWILPLTAALVVVGHCWPIFAHFRGGMGLAPAGGAILAISPTGFFTCVLALVLLLLLLRHAARASLFAGLVISPLLWLVGLRGAPVWIAAAVGSVIALRFLRDWNRRYKELWLDRPSK